SDRYAHGMSKDAYKQLVNALMGNRESRMDTLIAWSRAIVPFYEENRSNPERFLTHINSIGQRSWKDLFDRAYDERQDIRRRNGYGEVKEYSAVLLLGFLLSLVLFGVGVYLRHSGSRFFNTKTLEKIEWTFHAFFWSFLMLEIMPRTHSGYVELPGIAMWIIFIGSIVLFTVNWRILASRFLLKRRWGKYFLSVGGLGLIYIALNITQALNPFLRNTFALVDGSWYVTDYPYEWHPSPSFEDMGIAFVIMMLIAPFYAIIRHIVLNGIPRLRAQKEALNAELNTLKTQISPHFFFNSLNTVYGFALTEESPRTAEAITKLSDLMRFAIYHGDKKQIPLETELEYLSDYIDMQRLRINPIKHDLQYRVDGDANDLQIAPLMLITLIENAFKHGISMSQESYIHIDLFILDKGLILTVENSVHPKDLVAVGGNAVIKESGVGLVNTRERLNLLYAGKHEWRIEEDEDRYFTQLSLDLAE
ncbi:MAG: histidine kinase, partial [Bacteroidota bacterium]